MWLALRVALHCAPLFHFKYCAASGSGNTMSKRGHLHSRGFTLVEIAIVLVIIGFLLAGILNAQSVLRNARTKDTIKAVNDMAGAAQQFHDRYGAWPGTLQTATTAIPNMSATCVGNATGLIASAAESACASESLIRSSMLRGDATQPIRTAGTNGLTTLSVTGAALSGVAGLLANWRNVVRIQNTDCDVIVQMDRLLDDGSVNTGNLRTAAGVCGAGGSDQSEILPVANAVLRLN
jgi:prepilin-type N-terminal cleavage/methylation domain-containing protein